MKIALAPIPLVEKPKPSWPWNTSRWRNLRRRFLQADPICNRCNAAPSEHLHHLVPVSEGGEGFDPENLQALCRACHHAVTAEHYRFRKALKWQRLLPPS